MPQYLLAVHTSTDSPPDQDAAGDRDTAPDHGATRDHEPDKGDMEAQMQAIMALEEDMQATGTWLFSGRLSDPDVATVVRRDSGRPVTTDGPFAESKEHMAGFYIIDTDDLDKALAWADRVTDCLGVPIEVRPFVATGDVRSHMEGTA